jgi:hypothetical protein
MMDKNNYLKKYPLPQLCPKGELAGCDFFAVSSGSTGLLSLIHQFSLFIENLEQESQPFGHVLLHMKWQSPEDSSSSFMIRFKRTRSTR